MTEPILNVPLKKPEPKPEVTTGNEIAGLVPRTLDEAFRLATALSQAEDMIPEPYRGKAQAVMAAMLKGAEIGLAPMTALWSIAVINGRPIVWGDAIPALLLRAGHFIDVELEGQGDQRRAVATLTRADGRQVVRSFSVQDAKTARLWGKLTKSGGPTPWVTHPDRMLSARARTFAARDGAADALLGLEIAEVGEYGPDRARDITPGAPRRGGVVYREPDAPADEILEHAPSAAESPQDGQEAQAAPGQGDEGEGQ